VKPHIVRTDEAGIDDPAGEFYQSPEELGEYLQFTYCIKCGCCMAACPYPGHGHAIPGPMPLAAAQRYKRGHARRRAARPQPGDGQLAWRLPLPLCGRMFARVPQGCGPGQSDPVSQAPVGAGLPAPARRKKPCAKLHGRAKAAARQHHTRAGEDGVRKLADPLEGLRTGLRLAHGRCGMSFVSRLGSPDLALQY